MHRNGFSLVELSIVLVILGLLTGGILAGQSLIRAAELRAVTTEQNRWATALGTFRDKYFSIPGDFRDATKFWNLQVAGSGCISNHGLSTAGSPGACDGDGDGIIEPGVSASQAAEFAQFWRQLALAGLIEGTYSGMAGTGGNWHAVGGTNTPRSKLNNAIWSSVWWVSPMTGNAELFNGVYGNTLIIGGQTTTIEPTLAVFKPEEAWNIDTKMDDGKPATGSIVVRSRFNGCTVSSAGVDLTTAAADAAVLDASYKLSATNATCALIFRGFY